MKSNEVVKVTTSVTLEPKQKNKLQQTLKGLFGSDDIHYFLDPKIFGGMVVTVGSRKLDLSLNSTFTGLKDTGEIVSVNDGVVWINGLDKVMAGEYLHIKDNLGALVMNLEENKVGAIILG